MAQAIPNAVANGSDDVKDAFSLAKVLNKVSVENSFATLAYVDRNMAASKVETLPAISTFSHFKFVTAGIEARVTWDHPRFTMFSGNTLLYHWPNCKIARSLFGWLDVGKDLGSDVLQQPPESVAGHDALPLVVAGSSSIAAAAPAQHDLLHAPNSFLHAVQLPVAMTRVSGGQHILSAPACPPEGHENAPPVSVAAHVAQPPVCDDDELVAVVKRYIAQLRRIRFQGAYGFIQLLGLAAALPCPVVVLQGTGENGACVYMAGEAKPGKNIYLRYSRNAARSNQGHYDIYRYRSHDSVYLIDHNDASLENFAAANQVFDAAQYATAFASPAMYTQAPFSPISCTMMTGHGSTPAGPA